MATKLQNAYETISDPVKRQAYDLRWQGIRASARARQESEKRQATAAQAWAWEKRAAELRAKKQQEEHAREERLRNLETNRWETENEIIEQFCGIRKLAADLRRLEDQDDEDLRQEQGLNKEKGRNGWWAYLASPVPGRVKETEEQKQERRTQRLHRLACRSIKESELAEKWAGLQKMQMSLLDVNSKIAAEKMEVVEGRKKAEEEARARRLRMEKEAREIGKQEVRKWIARAQKEEDERVAREAEAVREAQERARMADAAERCRKEGEDEEAERAQAMRRAGEAAQKTRQKRARWTRSRTKSGCRHDRKDLPM